MIDIKYIRENPDHVKTFCANKKIEVDIDDLIATDAEYREKQTELGVVQKERNEAAKAQDHEAGKAIKEKMTTLQEAARTLEEKRLALWKRVPNIPSEDTPAGKTEDDNKVLKTVGDIPKFDFEPKEHWELGEALDLIDKETAAEVSGARFAYLKNDLVMMHFALLQLVMQMLTNREKLAQIIKDAELDVPDTPFTPILPPTMIRTEVFAKMDRLDPPEDRYYIPSDDSYLIGSAEHTLGPIYMGKTLKEEDLPIRLLGYSPAFRREAGTYGKDTKGIIRLHQFEKLEMESFATPEQGRGEHELFIAIQEHITQMLNIPYQLVLKCTGDQGKPDARAVDIEAWMPGQGKYRETHTADYMTDYQARRLGTKVKGENGKTYVHMNDATAFAGRTLVAVLENYQQADGTIRIPEVLQPIMGKTQIG